MSRVSAIADAGEDARRLGQAALQVTEILGLYQAELARILGLQCREGVAMVHWLRVPLPGLSATPHRLMMDEGRLADLVTALEAAAAR